MLRIGLTGGIGSGKTLVSELFAGLGATVIDTDVLARELTMADSAATRQIVAVFGPHAIGRTGSLNRRWLRETIFTDAAKREQLENILHPLIRHRALERIAEGSGPYCILVVPLLLEKGWQDMVDRILVVDTTPELQQARTSARDGRPDEEITAIMAAQCTRQQRLAAADDVILNLAGEDSLLPQVARLHAQYLLTAGLPQVPAS